MADRPILFSGPMVRAILDGRKTVTRRVIKPHPDYDGQTWHWGSRHDGLITASEETIAAFLVAHAPFTVGDRLWVREAWARADDPKWLVAYRADGRCGAWGWDGDGAPIFIPHGYVLDPARGDHLGNFGLPRFGGRWRPSIHMPRWASRVTLTVTDVRAQRLQEIDEADAAAEGIQADGQWPWQGASRLENFESLWDGLNAKRGFGWDENPWVWAYTFSVERRNVDAGPQANEDGTG